MFSIHTTETQSQIEEGFRNAPWRISVNRG